MSSEDSYTFVLDSPLSHYP